LRTYVLREGRVERAEGLDRGKPVLRSAEEWRSIYIGQRRQLLKSLCILVPILTYVTLALVFVGLVLITGLFFWDIAIGVILLTSVVVLIVMTCAVIAERMAWKGPTPGLYEHGVQMDPTLFLPYKELSEAKVWKVSVGLVPRTPPRRRPPSIGHPVSWTMTKELLGEDGVAVLIAKVAGQSEGDVPPKLVIYGSDGPG
jgi:hypothetical protein